MGDRNISERTDKLNKVLSCDNDIAFERKNTLNFVIKVGQTDTKLIPKRECFKNRLTQFMCNGTLSTNVEGRFVSV